jgi:hypothetical protein
VGVIATHEEYPIERMRLDRNKKWLGSVSHDECIKLTDVENMLEDSDDEGEGEGEANEDDDEDEDMADGDAKDEETGEEEAGSEEEEEADSDSDVDMDDDRKRSKKEGGKSGMGDMGRTHKKTEEGGFFDDL